MKQSTKQAKRGRRAQKGRPVKPAVRRSPARARRFTAQQRAHALSLVVAGMERARIAKLVGATTESIRRWVIEANANGTMPTPPAAGARATLVAQVDAGNAEKVQSKAPKSPYAPRDPGQGLSDPEVAAILELKKRHPAMGPAQLRAQLKRFKGWRLSIKAIARVLRGHGYELVHRASRPQGPEPARFEAPRRNALWQADYAEVRVHAEKLYVLVILDDFSRFVVGHALVEQPSSATAAKALQAAIARHGKPEAVRTDRGGGFIAFTKDTDFARVLEAELIDHIVGRSYSPRGGGKVEATIGTLRRELWELAEFADRTEAEHRLTAFFDAYNHHRAHLGIDGLTPADRFFGRADSVLATIDAISRRRQGVMAQQGPAGAPLDEGGLGRETGAPLEVLRLLIVDGVMELRFCGARVVLGRVES